MSIDDDRYGPVTRAGRAAIDALNAAMWSSTAADRLFRVVRPADFQPGDDTIAAAILDLRRRGVDWSDPMPVLDNLCHYRDLWKDRVDSGRLGLPKMEIPVQEFLDPDRWPLRFAGRALQTCRAYDVMRHMPEADVDAAAKEVAASRRHEVAEATMQTVHRILTDPDPDLTRPERQQAIGRVVREYRQTMVAEHLYARRPQHGAPRDRDKPGISR